MKNLLNLVKKKPQKIERWLDSDDTDLESKLYEMILNDKEIITIIPYEFQIFKREPEYRKTVAAYIIYR